MQTRKPRTSGLRGSLLGGTRKPARHQSPFRQRRPPPHASNAVLFLNPLKLAGFLGFFGARPLKRAIQAQIENSLAKVILEGRFAVKDAIRLSCVGGLIRFEKV